MEEATNMVNKTNRSLYPTKFIGQYESISKWIPRSCSVYADPIIVEEKKDDEENQFSDVSPAELELGRE